MKRYSETQEVMLKRNDLLQENTRLETTGSAAIVIQVYF